jgi:DNA polymerase III sliding clamp (beta) subunit (PCNA family)
MKIYLKTLHFKKSVLLDALYKTSIVVPAKPLVPYCEFVRIRKVSDHLLFSATDTTQDMCLTVPCGVTDQIDITLLHKDLWAYVKTIDSEDITFIVEEKRCVVKYGDSDTKAIFPTGDGEVVIQACDVEAKVFVRSEDVDQIYHGTIGFVANDDVREFLNGAMCFVHKGKAEIYAGNNQMFHQFSLPLDITDRKFILPIQFIRAMHMLNSETMYIGVDDKSCWLESAGAKYFTKMVDSEVPDMKKIFAEAKNATIDVSFNPQDMLNAIKKASIFSDWAVKLAFVKDSMRIYAVNSEHGKEFSTFINCKHNAPTDFQIGLAHKMLSKALHGHDVMLKITDHDKAVFLPFENSTYLLMPCAI